VEINDLIGICDIQCYKCFINTYAVLKVWDTNSSFIWKQDLWSKVFMVEEVMEESMAPWRRHAWCFASTDLLWHLSISLDFL
jgi:hypothetical protein